MRLQRSSLRSYSAMGTKQDGRGGLFCPPGRYMVRQRRHHEVSLMQESLNICLTMVNQPQQCHWIQKEQQGVDKNILTPNSQHQSSQLFCHCLCFYGAPPETTALNFGLLWYCDTTPHWPKLTNITSIDFNLARPSTQNSKWTNKSLSMGPFSFSSPWHTDDHDFKKASWNLAFMYKHIFRDLFGLSSPRKVSLKVF